jgi:hypothetical protein
VAQGYPKRNADSLRDDNKKDSASDVSRLWRFLRLMIVQANEKSPDPWTGLFVIFTLLLFYPMGQN